VAPAKRGPEIKSFDEAFPSLNKVIEAPAVKKAAWSGSGIKALAAASAVVATPTDRKGEISAAMANAEAEAAVAVSEGRKPRCVVIDISGQSESDDEVPAGYIPNMKRYFEVRAERLRKEAERLKAERRRVFDYSSEESAESVPEDDGEEDFYPSEEEGAEGDGAPIEGGDEYEFRR
jgi:hypothetical protein